MTRAFAFYDPEKKAWTSEAGAYRLLVGASSRDIKATLDYRLAEGREFR